MRPSWKILAAIAVWVVVGFVWLNPVLVILLMVGMGDAHRSAAATTPYAVAIIVLSIGWILAVGSMIWPKIRRRRRMLGSVGEQSQL